MPMQLGSYGKQDLLFLKLENNWAFQPGAFSRRCEGQTKMPSKKARHRDLPLESNRAGPRKFQRGIGLWLLAMIFGRFPAPQRIHGAVHHLKCPSICS